MRSEESKYKLNGLLRKSEQNIIRKKNIFKKLLRAWKSKTKASGQTSEEIVINFYIILYLFFSFIYTKHLSQNYRKI